MSDESVTSKTSPFWDFKALPEQFEYMRTLWDAWDDQCKRINLADEFMEGNLGVLAYVGHQQSLSEQEVGIIQREAEKFAKTRYESNRVKNVIGQSLIIEIDRLIKGISQDINDARGEPFAPLKCLVLPPGVVQESTPWALGVRAAGNYIRHKIEWMNQAARFLMENGREPGLIDFDAKAQRNLPILCNLLLPYEVASIVKADFSCEIASRLSLTSPDLCIGLFEEWKGKVLR